MTKLAVSFFAALMITFAGTASYAADCGNAPASKPTIIEVVTFKVSDGLSDNMFLATATEMEKAFLCKMPGFVRRTLSKGNDGTWLDYIEWATLDNAETAMKNSMANKQVGTFVQSIVPESVKVNHWRMLSETK
jgi:hypothetical protein